MRAKIQWIVNSKHRNTHFQLTPEVCTEETKRNVSWSSSENWTIFSKFQSRFSTVKHTLLVTNCIVTNVNRMDNTSRKIVRILTINSIKLFHSSRTTAEKRAQEQSCCFGFPVFPLQVDRATYTEIDDVIDFVYVPLWKSFCMESLQKKHMLIVGQKIDNFTYFSNMQ